MWRFRSGVIRGSNGKCGDVGLNPAEVEEGD